jgi:hypothetical protein
LRGALDLANAMCLDWVDVTSLLSVAARLEKA